MLKSELSEILYQLEIMFPNAGCELKYQNLYELIIAVVLSAQTTDRLVNTVTPKLFQIYPDFLSLAKAEYDDVKDIIKTIGLSHNKSRNIVNLAKKVISDYSGILPSTLEELKSLDGVGQKTANVVLSEGFNIPRIAVDTHVERVSKRLGIVSLNATVIEVEKALMSLIDQSLWHKAHHLLLFFGRYHCLAKKPMCEKCFYKDKCFYINKSH